MRLNGLSGMALIAAAAFAAAGAGAQIVDDPAPNELNIPTNPQFFGTGDPSVRKATAIVNGDVITGTDVDHRLALMVLANDNVKIPAEEMQRWRAQVLRNLVDETLEIQAAEAKDIKVESKEIDAYYEQYARNLGRGTKEFSAWLRSNGSSDRSIKRQIHGELAWRRLQGREIEPQVNVSEDEVKAMIERLKAAKGTQEYRISEIFLSASPETAAEVQANANRIVQQIRNGASLLAYARQFSEASTAAVGGDLGWVRAEQLPEVLAAAAKQLPVGQVSNPIPVAGGFSIIAVQDTKQVLTADPRDAVLSLKQLSITFPPGTTRPQAEAKVQALAAASKSIGGCGGAEAAAASLGAELVQSDQTKVRDLPVPLQEMLLGMSIGQATQPFGSFEDGVRILVLCGRDDPQQTNGPSFDQVYAQLEEARINARARRYLRDLRRDAVVEYR
ncbi:MAG TPA: peptidylprolyl isomerase [Allosphingosinicella sp.]|nr:peptidylprolyl isomerase [Allosphingosinicella sp.]